MLSKKPLIVEIEHPVVAPTALPSLAHGLDRRFAGSVAVGSRNETPAPRSAPDSVGRPPERCGQQPSERPTIASPHSPLEYRPAALAEESSSLTTAGSRACRGCPKGWPRTPQSTVRPRQPLRGWPSPRLKASQASRLGILNGFCLVHGLLPFPVGQWPRLNNAAPSAPGPHYKTFLTTTGCSVPALRVGTLALAVGAACGLSLHAIGVTKRRFSRSIRKPGRASRRLHAGCRSGGLRHLPN